MCLENTHPFARELWGRVWTFAHNGRLRYIKRRPLRFYRPIGTTDSEYAFCWMLDQLRARHPEPPKRAGTLWRRVRDMAGDIDGLGKFNFLLSDSRHLYCHCSNRLAWITRRAPFGAATLIDEEMSVDFSKETTPDDVVTVVATRPLTRDERWNVMKRGTFLVLHRGEVVND